VVVGIAPVVGVAVVPGRVVGVTVVVVGCGLVVAESTRAGPDPPQAARRQAVAAASHATATPTRRPGNPAPRALYAGFPPAPLVSPT
jgi:hypothetical protein